MSQVVADVNVEAVIARLKAEGTAIEFPGGRLRAVTEATDSVAALLARWRRANADGFTTRFTVTDEGTKTWLHDQVIANPRRVLLLVAGDDGRAVGHVGFMSGDAVALPVEIDNVLRGEPAPQGFMRKALFGLLGWLATHVSEQPVGLRVLASNPRALGFYQRCGFREVDRIDLIETRDGDRVSFVPGDTDVVDQYETMARDPQTRRPDDVESP